LQVLRGTSAGVGIDWVDVGAGSGGPISCGPSPCGALGAVGRRLHWFSTRCARLQQAATQQSIDGHFHGGLLHICS
jgi:hypothetical protein